MEKNVKYEREREIEIKDIYNREKIAPAMVHYMDKCIEISEHYTDRDLKKVAVQFFPLYPLFLTQVRNGSTL